MCVYWIQTLVIRTASFRAFALTAVMSADALMHEQVSRKGGWRVGALIYRCINEGTVWFLWSWALLFWFCCMTLLGWVPEENLAESGSNVKSAAESRTEQQNLKRVLDVRLYGWKKVQQLAASPHFAISLIIVSDLTFRNRFVNVRRHIILLVSQTLNNQWRILLCDLLGMPFELHVAKDEHSTDWVPAAV